MSVDGHEKNKRGEGIRMDWAFGGEEGKGSV